MRSTRTSAASPVASSPASRSRSGVAFATIVSRDPLNPTPGTWTRATPLAWTRTLHAVLSETGWQLDRYDHGVVTNLGGGKLAHPLAHHVKVTWSVSAAPGDPSTAVITLPDGTVTTVTD